MKKADIAKVLLEGLIGIALSLAVESITTKLKERNKKESPDSTLVGDLTVAELKQILKEEA